MSVPELESGAVIHMKSVDANFWRTGDQSGDKPAIIASYEAPKGNYFTSIILGISDGVNVGEAELESFFESQGFINVDKVANALKEVGAEQATIDAALKALGFEPNA